MFHHYLLVTVRGFYSELLHLPGYRFNGFLSRSHAGAWERENLQPSTRELLHFIF